MKKLMLLVLVTLGFGFAGLAQQDTTINQFTGKYKFPDGSVVAEVFVTVENGVLVMNSTAGNSPLAKEAEDLYIIVSLQGKAFFRRDAGKRVVGVSINAMGYQLEGTKENAFVLADKSNNLLRFRK